MIKMLFTDFCDVVDNARARADLYDLKGKELISFERKYGPQFTDKILISFVNETDELTFKLKHGEVLKCLK